MSFAFQFLRGKEITPFIEEIGGLRIAVFREFPYLYDGTPDYERPYLERYASNERSLIVAMRHEGQLVGATSCQPLADEMSEFRAPFENQHLATGEYFYLGESIILPPWRGNGAGKSFFRFREEHAASFRGYAFTTFCAVERSPDHPLRPADYRPLDGFWERNGYQKRPDLQCDLNWKEPQADEDLSHTLTFWTKPLSPHSSEELAS